MRYWTMLAAAAAVVTLAGCKKTSDGRVVVEHPGEVNITTKADTLSVPQVHVGTATDTVNTPTVVMKKTVVKHPTVSVTKH